MEQRVTVSVNGTEHVATVPIRRLLVDFIREDVGLTGTHVGCSYEGRCGACTVVLDGEAVKSCLLLAVQADGRSVLTSEGLAQLSGDESELHPIQQAFWERGGLQCGYCTSGMLMTVFDLLRTTVERNRPDELSEEEIRHALVGNICRCTGYSHIVEAVQTAAASLQEMTPDERRAYLSAPAAGAAP